MSGRGLENDFVTPFEGDTHNFAAKDGRSWALAIKPISRSAFCRARSLGEARVSSKKSKHDIKQNGDDAYFSKGVKGG